MKLLKNFFKGYFTTSIGVVLILFALADFLGLVSVPAPDGVTELQQIIYAAVIGIGLFFIKPGKIEAKANKIFDKKTDSL